MGLFIKNSLLCSIISCTLLLFSLNSFAQSEALLKHYSRKDGLKDVSYNSFIFKDSKGFLWISTAQSLDRYDGDNFKSYLIGSKDSLGIKGNFIQGNFYEDSNTDIWFATYEAVNRYNRKTDNFSSFQFITAANDTISKEYHLFYFDPLGEEIWSLVDKRIYSFKIDAPNSYSILPVSTNGKRFLFREFEDGRKEIIACPWMVGRGIEVIADSGSGNWENEYLSLEEINSPHVSQAISIDEQFIWLVSDEGLVRLDRSNERNATVYTIEDGMVSPFWQGGVFDNYNLILTSFKDGVWFFNFKEKNFSRNITNGQELVLSTSLPKDIFIENENNVWVSHYDKGIDNISLNLVQPFGTLEINGQNQIKTPVSKIVENGNKILIANSEDGVYEFSRSQNHFFQKTSHILKGQYIYDLVVDKQKILWANVGKVHAYRGHKFLKAEQPKDITLYFLISLSDDGLLASSSNELIRITNKEQVFDFEKLKNPTQSNFHRLFQKANGEILAASNTNQIKIFSLNKDSITLIRNIDTQSDVLSFYENPETETVWCGTTNGLLKLDSNNLNYFLQEEWQIGSVSVYSVLEDNDKRLWIGASNGFWTYDLTTEVLTKFHPENGIGEKTFMPNSQLKASDGLLWFGTNEGVIYFDPDSINLPISNPQVEIEAAWINDKPFKNYPVIGERKELDLTYRENSLSLRIACLDYQLPQYNQIRYRLKGYNEKWTVIKSGEKIRFTQIPYGKVYHLEVIGINANYTESALKNLVIRINLPFWQTWWFPLIILVCITCLALIIAHFYVRQKLKAQQIEMDKREALNQQRNAISNDLHDDIGNDLSQIISMSDFALLKEADQVKIILNDIADLASDSVKNLRYTMWSLDEKQNNLTDLLFKLKEYAHLFFKRHNISYQVLLPENSSIYKISPERRREIYLFYKESLNNIKKYAEANQVIIQIEIKNNQFFFLIKDDGIGFDLAERKGKGKGLLTMEERARNLGGNLKITTQPNQGTTILLAFPLA